jgi:iron complex outermembrane recepter protein
MKIKHFTKVALMLVASVVFAQEKEKDSILSVDLNEVVLTASGVIDLADNRVTPIAVTKFTAEEIQSRVGAFDIVESMRFSPSIQLNRGSGFGDAQMFLRGFDQTNTAFLINGQPINGVEDGKMYWSNWSGLADIANSVEVQRGLGSSKLAISSVGGTVNFVTKSVDLKEGGFVNTMMGNDNYYKASAYLSTGLMENGFAFSMLFGHWEGDGYHAGTQGQGQNYFFSVGYKPNNEHIFNLMITGAPQWHGGAREEKLSTFLDNGKKYGDNWGYLNGEFESAGRNFYHKPLFNLSWDYNISSTRSLSTVLYGSFGRGGFAYGEGDFFSDFTEDGLFDFDAMVARNEAGDGERIIKSSVNSHNWYGIVSNYSSELNDNLSYNIGFDVRMYNGIHFRTPTNLLGLDSYRGISSTYGYNPWDAVFDFPNETEDRAISYDYEEDINYYGFFGQLEYATDEFSAFVQSSVSSQSHVKKDLFFDLGEADKITNSGFNVKGGGSYVVSENSRVYANAGFYSRQPFHDDLYANVRYSNDINVAGNVNQEITGFELGYIYENNNLSANIDLYHTTWGNRVDSSSNYEDNQLVSYTETNPFSQLHKGIEAQVQYRLSDAVLVKAYASLGDWTYQDNVETTTFDDEGNLLSSDGVVYLEGLKVGQAAQTSYGFQMFAEVTDDLGFDITGNHYSDQYAEVDFGSSDLAVANNDGVLKTPSVFLLDFGMNYSLDLKNNTSMKFRLNINNAFDELYIENMTSNTPATDGSATWRGIDTSNNVRIGYGRTWNLGVRYNF